MDDKLSLFRQQASIIARKKEGTADRLNTLMEEATALAQESKRKMDQSQAAQGTRVELNLCPLIHCIDIPSDCERF
jgi:intraflagellar transport protein 81